MKAIYIDGSRLMLRRFPRYQHDLRCGKPVNTKYPANGSIDLPGLSFTNPRVSQLDFFLPAYTSHLVVVVDGRYVAMWVDSCNASNASRCTKHGT